VAVVDGVARLLAWCHPMCARASGITIVRSSVDRIEESLHHLRTGVR
jgi:hypothetical protein